MKYTPISSLEDAYCEISNLFVEWDFAWSPSDGPVAKGGMYLTNVQMRHPEDKERWLDITDWLDNEAKAQILGQIEDALIDNHHEED